MFWTIVFAIIAVPFIFIGICFIGMFIVALISGAHTSQEDLQEKERRISKELKKIRKEDPLSQ